MAQHGWGPQRPHGYVPAPPPRSSNAWIWKLGVAVGVLVVLPVVVIVALPAPKPKTEPAAAAPVPEQASEPAPPPIDRVACEAGAGEVFEAINPATGKGHEECRPIPECVGIETADAATKEAKALLAEGRAMDALRNRTDPDSLRRCGEQMRELQPRAKKLRGCTTKRYNANRPEWMAAHVSGAFLELCVSCLKGPATANGTAAWNCAQAGRDLK